MKKLVMIIAIFGVLAFLALPALAKPPTVVEGTGDPDTDWWAVQSAVDTGGKVLLKGTFNFGVAPPTIHTVIITNDVKIFGEKDNKGEPLTKITGGSSTFLTMPPLPAPDPPAQIPPGPKIEIRNIHFDGALFTPLHFSYISGAVISGNKITNVVPLEVPQTPTMPDFPKYWHVGIAFWTGPFYTEGLLPGALTGTLIFKNNQVDMDMGDFLPSETMGQGIFAVLTWGATFEVKGNTFTNASVNGIEFLDNFIDENGNGSIIIKNNRVTVPTESPPWPSDNGPNGIIAGWFNFPFGAENPDFYSEVLIKGNYVEMQGGLSKPYPETAIVLLQDEVVTKNNHIVLGGTPFGVGIYQNGSYGMVKNNRIEGWGYCAMWAARSDFIEEGGNNNTFRNNKIKNFNSYDYGFPWGFDVILDGDDNTLTGGRGAVLDNGIDNVIDKKYTVTP